MPPPKSAPWFSLAWHALGAGLLVSFGVSWLGPWAVLDPKFAPFLVGLAATYLTTAGVIGYLASGTDDKNAGRWSWALMPTTVFLVFLLGTEAAYSRVILAAALSLIPVLVAPPFVLRQTGRWLGLTALVLCCSAVATLALREPPPAPAAPTVEDKVFTTSSYTVRARYFRDIVDPLDVTGGGLALFDRDRYLLATGDGQLYILSWHPVERDLSAELVDLTVPTNRAAFAAAIPSLPNRNDSESHLFRSGSILVENQGSRFRLFVGHLYWHADQRCATIRLSSTESAFATFAQDAQDLTWRTVYESRPCLSDFIAGELSGMRLTALANGQLLMTLGDLGFDGLYDRPILAQDPSASYGKTVLIDPDTGASETFTLGHRDAQGLTVAPDGTIWSTEHGPQGGDELNVLEKHQNYGWPLATYGTQYNAPQWPFATDQGDHIGFRRPFFAWLPSVAVSDVLAVRSGNLAAWQGDLVVGSLGAASLFHLRIRDDRVIFQEPINVGRRVRSMVEDSEGRIVLWTEGDFFAPTTGSVVVLEFTRLTASMSAEGLATEAGRQANLAVRCSRCHNVGSGSHGYAGPSLVGVVGRPVASVSGFEYTPALRLHGGTWTRDTLDAFLTNPQATVPGTAMLSDGIADPQERAAILDLLEDLR
jgi:cytochrome c2